MGVLAINEALLQQIETLQIVLKNNVAGLFGGNHQSKTFGSSCEFADYRDYIPGDDITKIDWNAYARFEKLYLKLFLDERQVHTRIYIDASRSMTYGKGLKAKLALELAATFAYLSIVEMDKVSIYYLKDSEIHEVVSGMVGKEAYYNAIGKLNEIEFSGDCFISDAILPSKIGYGDGLSIIISDFLTDNDYENAIDYLVGKKRDLFCVQLLNSDELNPKVRGKVHFFDSENVEKDYRKNINRDIMAAYREALRYSINRLEGYCNARNAHYLVLNTEEKINDIFFEKIPNVGVLK